MRRAHGRSGRDVRSRRTVAQRHGTAVQAQDRTGPAPLLVFLLVVAALLAASALPDLAGNHSRSTTTTATVQVGATDTLWSIARANPVPGVPTARAVEAIRDLNGLASDAHLQPGTVVQVPAPAPDAALAMR
jgi:hypothetical protein